MQYQQSASLKSNFEGSKNGHLFAASIHIQQSCRNFFVQLAPATSSASFSVALKPPEVHVALSTSEAKMLRMFLLSYWYWNISLRMLTPLISSFQGPDVGVSGGAGVSVSGGMGVTVSGGMGVFVSGGMGVFVSGGIGVTVSGGIGVSVNVGMRVLVGLSVGVYVAGWGFGVLVGAGSGVWVLVRATGGRDVRPGGNKVARGKLVSVLKATNVFVGASVAVLVLVISGCENACTVCTIIVFILEITKSTTPAVGVPMETALLISFMPTTPAPHSKLTPNTAAATTPKSGR
jgi:hypothetical protein